MHNLLEKVFKTLAYYMRKMIVGLRQVRFSLNKAQLERPIFVIGCSRAGTTLVYKTLSESSEIGTLHKETHDFWAKLHPISERNWDSHRIPETMACESDREQVARLFYTHTGKSRIVDKNNQNGLSVPYLIRLFPDARFVYIKRNAGDNINSLIEGWGKADEFATWSNEVPARIAVDDGRFSRWCFFLADGWRELTESSIEEVCAFQYRAMNQAILDARANIPASQWFEIKYEKLIADPVKEFEAIYRHCGLNFDQKVRLHCETVLQKPYNTFSEIKLDKWKDSANQEKIERILPSLNEIVDRMGY